MSTRGHRTQMLVDISAIVERFRGKDFGLDISAEMTVSDMFVFHQRNGNEGRAVVRARAGEGGRRATGLALRPRRRGQRSTRRAGWTPWMPTTTVTTTPPRRRGILPEARMRRERGPSRGRSRGRGGAQRRRRRSARRAGTGASPSTGGAGAGSRTSGSRPGASRYTWEDTS